MSAFLSTWSLKQDLSYKVGAVFVTSGGISAGEELTMVNLLHSLMIFRMIIVGGERWTSAFGASAVIGEGPFTSQHDSEKVKKMFPSICYPTNPNGIHEMFQEKAIGLGERVALVASKIST
jgi:multimeric flavodoxin WrbA